MSALAALIAAAVTVTPAEQARTAAVEAGFGDIADRVAEAARPAMLLERTRLDRAPRRLGTSRMGGPADLPVGEPWPVCGRRAQTFLMQVRLRDLPPRARALRRLGGRLLVFTQVRLEYPDARGYGLWAGRCTTVLHVPAGTRLQRQASPRDTLNTRPVSLRFESTASVPDVQLDAPALESPLQDVAMPPDRQEAWWTMLDRLAGPEPEHQLLGYGATPNGGDGCYAKTQRARRPWRHLLTVGPDYALRFEVADAGRLQVAIAPGDLRRGRFDRVCGTFDSA